MKTSYQNSPQNIVNDSAETFFYIFLLEKRAKTPSAPPAYKSPPSPGFPDHLLLPQAGDVLHGFPVGRGDPTERDVPRGAVENLRRGVCALCAL